MRASLEPATSPDLARCDLTSRAAQHLAQVWSCMIPGFLFEKSTKRSVVNVIHVSRIEYTLTDNVI